MSFFCQGHSKGKIQLAICHSPTYFSILHEILRIRFDLIHSVFSCSKLLFIDSVSFCGEQFVWTSISEVNYIYQFRDKLRDFE